MLAHAELAQLQLTEVAQLIRAWQNPGDPAPGSTPWSLGRSLSKDYPNGVTQRDLRSLPFEEVAQAVRVVADGLSLISPSMAVKLIDEFKQMPGSEQGQGSGLRLTERELEVLRLVSTGLSNREIAQRLFISENTVKNHVRNILEKLQLHSRMEAVMYAVREHLLDLP